MVVSAPVPSRISDPGAPTTTLGSPRYRREYDAFAQLLEGKRIPAGSLIVLLGKSLLGLVEMAIRYVPAASASNFGNTNISHFSSISARIFLSNWAAFFL